MRRMIPYVAVWFVAGATAVALASVAVSTVGNQVTGSRPSPLSADEVRAELAGDNETTTTASSGGTTSTLPPGATPTTTNQTPTTAPQGGGTGGGPTAEPTTTVAPPAPQAEIRTYNLIGGTVTLRFAPSGVTLQEATPKPGYRVEDEPDESNGWQVTFDSEAHRSRVEGWWDGGPQDEVEEKDKSDG